MRNALAAVSVLGLAGLAGFVGWSSLSRPDSDFITGDAARGFNLDAPITARTVPELRDAVAAPPAMLAAPAAPAIAGPLSPRPIALEGMATGAPLRAGTPPGTVARFSPKAEAWARGHARLTALLARPAALLARGSALGSARDLRAFLDDKARVNAYLDSPLVRVILNRPAVAKALLGNPAVVRAALESPALRDPQALRALLASPMLHKMLDCPGIQEALSDEGVMRRLWTDPATVAWIATHPEALATIAQAAPALAQGFAR